MFKKKDTKSKNSTKSKSREGSDPNYSKRTSRLKKTSKVSTKTVIKKFSKSSKKSLGETKRRRSSRESEERPLKTLGRVSTRRVDRVKAQPTRRKRTDKIGKGSIKINMTPTRSRVNIPKKINHQHLEVLVRIGKNGLNDSTIKEMKTQIRRKKVIKIKILKSALDGIEKKKLVDEIVKKTGAKITHKVGFVVVLEEVKKR